MDSSVAPETATVWLIENDRTVRPLLAEMLSSAGLHVETLPDGERLFEPDLSREVPGEAPPQVIVTDLDLGAACHDGLEVARQARRRWPDLGVVFVTGQPMRLNAHEQGERDRFVVKPFRAAQLIGAVTSLLRP